MATQTMKLDYSNPDDLYCGPPLFSNRPHFGNRQLTDRRQPTKRRKSDATGHTSSGHVATPDHTYGAERRALTALIMRHVLECRGNCRADNEITG